MAFAQASNNAFSCTSSGWGNALQGSSLIFCCEISTGVLSCNKKGLGGDGPPRVMLERKPSF